MSMHICAHLLHSWSHTDLCKVPLTVISSDFENCVSPSAHRSFENIKKKEVHKIMHFRVMNAVNKSVITHTKNSPLWWIHDGVFHREMLLFPNLHCKIWAQISNRRLWSPSPPAPIPPLSRWHLLRWCCCPSGAEKKAGLCWRNKSGSSDSGFLLHRCHCSMMW